MDASTAFATLGQGSAKSEPVTFRETFTGVLIDLHTHYLRASTLLGFNELHNETRYWYPWVSIESFGPSAVNSAQCDVIRNRDLGKIGSWSSEKSCCTLTLLLADRVRDPFAAIHREVAPDLVLVVEYHMPDGARPDLQVELDVRVTMQEPATTVTVKGLVQESQKLGGLSAAMFNRHRTVIACDLDNTATWRKKLRTWAVPWGHTECLIHFDIDSRISLRPDLTKLGVLLATKPEICDLIIEELSLFDVRRLRGVCSALRTSLEGVTARRLRRALNPYFRDIPAFCAQLQQWHALVGGSTPLSVIRPGPWVPGDLDLIVHEYYASGFVSFLTQEGYTEVKSVEGTPIEYDGHVFGLGNVSRVVFDYKCFTKGGIKIDLSVVTSKDMSPADYVLTYHSTGVMNFFDGQALYCLFPKETSEGHYMLNRYTPTARVHRGLEKMRLKGYSLVRGFHTDIQDILPHDDSGRVKASDVKTYWVQNTTL